MEEAGEKTIGGDVDELAVLYAIRTMFGDERCKKAMESLQENQPDAFKVIMAEAERRYAELPTELIEQPEKALFQLRSKCINLRFKMILKGTFFKAMLRKIFIKEKR